MKWYPEIQHGSDEWRSARLGRVSSSKIGVFFTSKYELSKGAGIQTYMNGKLWERLSGKPPREDGFENASTRWGNEQEAYALVLIEGATVAGVFCSDLVASTPDGLIWNEDEDPTHTVEIKCPNSSGQSIGLRRAIKDVATFKAEEKDYYVQVQHQLYCAMQVFPTIRAAIFAAYDPDLPTQLVTLEVPVDQGLHDKFRAVESYFKAYINETV
jgi:YqaJ-like viral recombinase domain